MSEYRTLQYPLTVFWETTPQCNHNCVHCFNYWRSDAERSANLRRAAAREPMQTLAEKIASLHPVTVVLTGGEPLLVWEELYPCIEFFIEQGIRPTLNTNATLLTREIAEFLAEHNIPLLVSFPCAEESINDEITGTKGAYRRTVAGIKLLKDAGARFSCNVVVSRRNFGEVERTVGFLAGELGARRISLSRVGKPVNAHGGFDAWLLGPEEIRGLIEMSISVKKRFGIEIDASSPYPVCALETQEEYDLLGGKRLCSAGKTSVVVGSDGSLKACPRDSKIYGNLLRDGFDGPWEAMAEWRDGSLLPNECKNCNFLSNCRGACRADALADLGHCGGPDTAARPERLPLSFERKQSKIGSFAADERFAVARNILSVKERTGFRLTKDGNSTFVTDGAYAFLTEHPVFTPADLKTIVREEAVNAVLDRLLSLRLISQLSEV